MRNSSRHTTDPPLRPDRRPSHPDHFLRRRNHRSQTSLQNLSRVMGVQRKSRPATLGSIPRLATARSERQIAQFHTEKLPTARTFVHAMEGTFLGSRPSRQDHHRRQFRGLLLHLLQPMHGRRQRHLLPRQEREVSAIGAAACGSWRMRGIDGVSMTGHLSRFCISHRVVNRARHRPWSWICPYSWF